MMVKELFRAPRDTSKSLENIHRNAIVDALGRGLDYPDMPAVRSIVSSASRDGYRFSSIILGVVNSTPFRMRATPRSIEDVRN